MKRSGRLFSLDREVGFFPCLPPAFQDVNFGITEGEKLPCHTGTGFLAGSGAVKYEGFLFGIFFRPLIYIFRRVLPHCSPDFHVALTPGDGLPDIHDDDLRIGHHGLKLFRRNRRNVWFITHGGDFLEK